MKNKFLNTLLVIIGLTLSPITWWNDPLVNIPLSYLLSNILAQFFPKLFAISFVVFYWLTNILGIWMVSLGGKELISSFKISYKKQFIAITTYTILILLLSIRGIIKPIFLK